MSDANFTNFPVQQQSTKMKLREPKKNYYKGYTYINGKIHVKRRDYIVIKTGNNENQ